MCWDEGGDTIRRGHSRNASEPEHQVPCFRDPSAGRLSTPMGYSLPATTVGPPFLHPVPRCQELTSPAPASSAPGCSGSAPGGRPDATENPLHKQGRPWPTRGRARPGCCQPRDEHGTPHPCRPTESPRLASLSVPGPPQPLVYPQPPWHLAHQQMPASSRGAQAASHPLM